MEEIKFIPKVIPVIIHTDGKSAIGDNYSDRGKKYRIQDIMLGAGPMKKCLPWTANLKANTQCMAEILENGKLRII